MKEKSTEKSPEELAYDDGVQDAIARRYNENRLNDLNYQRGCREGTFRFAAFIDSTQDHNFSSERANRKILEYVKMNYGEIDLHEDILQTSETQSLVKLLEKWTVGAHIPRACPDLSDLERTTFYENHPAWN